MIDLSVPLSIQTPPWPTYEPLQVKYFKRLAPNGANGQLITTSMHVSTHIDGERHFHTPGKTIGETPLEDLYGPGVVVDLSDAVGDYEIYTSKMIEDRVKVKQRDILIISTGYHRYSWEQPKADEVRYMVKHPGPTREFAEWALKKELKWIGVDCGSADHPMNTMIRRWMPQYAEEAEKKLGKSLNEIFSQEDYQLMHTMLFPHGIIHAECVGGDIDQLLNKRTTIGCFPWRFIDGESSICRIVAFHEE